MMKKAFCSGLVVLICLSITPASAGAADTSEYMELREGTAVVTCHDGRSEDEEVVLRSDFVREYVESTYSVITYGISEYNVGPREDDVFLVSVPKGGTRTIQGEKTVSASVELSAGVDAGIAEIINFELTANSSGSFSHTYSTTKTYSGPEGDFTTRDYYGAIQYDQYAFTIRKQDKYPVYKALPSGKLSVWKYEYESENIVVNDVKGPKEIEYYRDFNN